MTAPSVSVHLPEGVYRRLEKAATRLQKPVEALLVETLEAALPSEETIPQYIQAEIEILPNLSTEQLQQIARGELLDLDQQALEQLLYTQSLRELSIQETAELERLRREYGRILLRKARAFAILAERNTQSPTD